MEEFKSPDTTFKNEKGFEKKTFEERILRIVKEIREVEESLLSLENKEVTAANEDDKEMKARIAEDSAVRMTALSIAEIEKEGFFTTQAFGQKEQVTSIDFLRKESRRLIYIGMRLKLLSEKKGMRDIKPDERILDLRYRLEDLQHLLRVQEESLREAEKGLEKKE